MAGISPLRRASESIWYVGHGLEVAQHQRANKRQGRKNAYEPEIVAESSLYRPADRFDVYYVVRDNLHIGLAHSLQSR